MHLQSQQVADAMRQEHAGEPAGDRFVRIAADEVRIAQHRCHGPVRGQMDVRPLNARAHLRAQRLLGRSMALMRAAKSALSRRATGGGVGAGDIGGVAAPLRTGIDQQGVVRCGRLRA